MKTKKPGKRPRSLLRKTALFFGTLAVLCLTVFLAYLLYVFITNWLLEKKFVNPEAARVYSVQESHYTNAYSWYTSYPKMDQEPFDRPVAKIIGDAKGRFLARVKLDASTKQPTNDLNITYVVNKATNNHLTISITVRQALGKKYDAYVKQIFYDQASRKLEVKDAAYRQADEVTVLDESNWQPKEEEVDCSAEKCVALTFDGGPSPVTLRILGTLKAVKAKATFFEVGSQVKLYPEVARRVSAEGSAIGNGTYDYRNLLTLPTGDAVGELAKGAAAIKSTSGVQPMFARAPFGAVNSETLKNATVPFIGWSVDAGDEKTSKVEDIYQSVMARVKPGAIVISHDMYDSTADAYGRIIPDLVAKKYKLVTIPQLLAGSKINQNDVISRRH